MLGRSVVPVVAAVGVGVEVERGDEVSGPAQPMTAARVHVLMVDGTVAQRELGTKSGIGALGVGEPDVQRQAKQRRETYEPERPHRACANKRAAYQTRKSLKWLVVSTTCRTL